MNSRSTSLAALVSQATAVNGVLPCSANAQLWFSDQVADLEQAKASCRTCPLRRPCLAGALERAEPWGVWGGEIFENGAIIAQKRPRGRPVADAAGQASPRSPSRLTLGSRGDMVSPGRR